MASLDAQLLAAHAAGDGYALVDLYRAAAEQAGSLDEQCYFLTFAYVYGLEVNHPAVPDIHARLKEHGRV